jgi:hypothetical protein
MLIVLSFFFDFIFCYKFSLINVEAAMYLSKKKKNVEPAMYINFIELIRIGVGWEC